MQIVFDFVAGDMPFDDFWAAYQDNPQIGFWLDQLTDFRKDPPPRIAKDSMLLGIYNGAALRHNGHILPILKKQTYPPPRGNYASIQNMVYSIVATAVLAAYPNAASTRYYQRNSDYHYKAMGRSIGGKKVAAYANTILDQFHVTMKAVDRVKAGKEALWAAFHIKDRKFPRWAQEADWPMGKNSPMEYLGQHRDGELVALRFRDVDTGEIRVVEQFY